MDGLNCKVSILVPVYGVERYIERCAHSLFGQTYVDIEYVFVNDCTKDRSIDILKRVLKDYPNREQQVRIVRHEYNRGLAAARNTAFDNSTGEYVMHVDSDDFIETDAVELFLKCAREKKADIVVCDNRCVYKDHVVMQVQTIPPQKQDYLTSLLIRRIQPSIWGKFFYREFYKKSGVRAVEGVNFGEDYAFVPRIVYYANVIVKLDCFLYNYVLYNNQSYTKNISVETLHSLCEVDKILDNFFSSVPDSTNYTKTLIIAKLRTKTYLLKISGMKLWKVIMHLYPELSHYEYLLPMPDRLILWMLCHKWFRLLKGILVIRTLFQRHK